MSLADAQSLRGELPQDRAEVAGVHRPSTTDTCYAERELQYNSSLKSIRETVNLNLNVRSVKAPNK